MCLFVSLITLLTLMAIYLIHCRFGATEPFRLCPPPYLVNIGTIFRLCVNLFWVDTTGCPTTEVRDFYRTGVAVLKSLEWCLFYPFAVPRRQCPRRPWASRSATLGRRFMFAAS